MEHHLHQITRPRQKEPHSLQKKKVSNRPRNINQCIKRRENCGKKVPHIFFLNISNIKYFSQYIMQAELVLSCRSITGASLASKAHVLPLSNHNCTEDVCHVHGSYLSCSAKCFGLGVLSLN